MCEGRCQDCKGRKHEQHTDCPAREVKEKYPNATAYKMLTHWVILESDNSSVVIGKTGTAWWHGTEPLAWQSAAQRMKGTKR